MTMIADNGPAPGAGDTTDTRTRTSAPVGGGINRLHAFDGLFLRAEHLTRIQDYAGSLAYAAGQAAGHGVVYGFDVSAAKVNDQWRLEVGPGLAINPQGRPLKSEQTATVPLDGLLADPNGYWVVEVIAGETPFGDESVYGLLCDDPCSGGSSMRPFVAEGIRVRLTPRAEDGLNQVSDLQRRGWLASRLFENERRDGGPWLTPATAGGTVPPLSTRPWQTGAPPPTGEAVPVAVLLRTANEWEVDAWAVRREIGDPSPQRVWRWRLGMRPWQVFVAQVLQFQDLLTFRQSPRSGLTAAMLQQHVEEQLDYAIARVRERKQKEPLQVLNVLRSTLAGQVTQAAQVAESLPGLGIDELPPAGYLPISGSASVEDQVAALLGANVDLRFCRCRPDHVPHAVEEVQHMDRLVLGDPDRPPAIDILVPVPADGEAGPATTAYGWVAFVRRRGADCGPGPVDEVGVYTVAHDEDVLTSLDEGVIPGSADELATAAYPPRTWAVPPPGAFALLRAAVPGHNKITLYGLASTDDRLPLAAVRAALLLGPLDDNTIDFVLRTAKVPAGGREAIVAVLGNVDAEPEEPTPQAAERTATAEEPS